MIVKDNGVGLPPEFDFSKTQTLGLKLVNFLVKHQLKAEIEINSADGTEFIFRFRDRNCVVDTVKKSLILMSKTTASLL